MSASGPLWQGGAAIDITDRALQYGDGLFETIAFRFDKGWLLDRHLRRLAKGIERLELGWPAVAQLAEVLAGAHRAAMRQPASVLKLMISAGGQQRGYTRAANTRALVRGALFALSRPPSVEGLRVYLCQTRLAPQPRLAGLKHLNRLEQVLACAEWDPTAFDEGLMLDSQGNLAEGTASNLLLALDDQLRTPPLRCEGVHGVVREYLLEMQQPAIATKDCAPSALSQVQGMWLCNSLHGVRPVTVLQAGSQTMRFQPSTWTAQLQRTLAQSWHTESLGFTDAVLLERLEQNTSDRTLLDALHHVGAQHA